MRTPAEELERVEALIERTANWLIQGRDGDDLEGERAARLYLDQLRKQEKELQKKAKPGKEPGFILPDKVTCFLSEGEVR